MKGYACKDVTVTVGKCSNGGISDFLSAAKEHKDCKGKGAIIR